MALARPASLVGPCLRAMATATSRRTCTCPGVVPLPEMKRYVRDCVVKAGAKPEQAEDMADLLSEADYRGHFSHGLNRLEMYIGDLESKCCDPDAEPVVLKENIATAWVDGRNSLGPVVGKFCMKLAIDKAREAGVGWVVAKGSNHYGIAGYYPMQALKAGMLGMSFTNTSPFMTPTRAKNSALGTNPLSVSAPGLDGDSYVLDMATTAVAVGKVELQMRKGEPIPEGWALDADGQTTTDPAVAMKNRRLMPLGGKEQNSGYKGFGLGLLVEVFSGILAGSNYGPNVRSWLQTAGGTPANLGQCFVAIDPERFAPGFQDRMSDLMNHLRQMEPVDPDKPVLVAGDPEQNHMKKVDAQGGINYHENQIKASIALADRLGVQPMKRL